MSAQSKKRLDQLLVDRGLSETKTKAQALIMSGQVFVDGQLSDKSGRPTAHDAEIVVKEAFPYVSRGALKLEKAYQEFGLDFDCKTVCDIGSSTGGFTDFALQHGATKVFAIDVGTGQLAQKIREDERVIVMEKTDFRDVAFHLPLSSLVANPGISSVPSEGDPRLRKDDKSVINDPINIFVCDVSFISLTKIIPKIAEIIQNSKFVTPNSTEIILLIKPQFEAGAKEVSRGKGVIRDERLRLEIVKGTQSFVVGQGFEVRGLTESPITGAKGNVEYLLYLKA